MRRALRSALCSLVAVIMVSSAFSQADIAGSRDCSGVARMPNTFIRSYKSSVFDSFTFPVTENNKEKKQDVEGKLCFAIYKIKEGTPPGSALETIRNYQNAARSAGGQVLWEYTAGINRRTTIRIRRRKSTLPTVPSKGPMKQT